MRTYTAEQIEAIGGSRWTKGGHDRVYLNMEVWAPLVGLEISTYKTGNISSAYLDGERISNTKAHALLSGRKVYWENSQIYTTAYNGTPDWFAEALEEGIAKKVAALDSDSDEGDSGSQQPTDAPVAAKQTDQPEPAAFIAALRAAGRTVAQIAALVGVSISTIYRWAHGACRPRPTNAAAIAALA